MADEGAPPNVPPPAPVESPPVESPAPDPVLLQLKAEVERLKSDRIESLRKLAGLKYNLPEAIVSRLKGESEAEIETDAKGFQALFPKVNPPPAPVAGTAAQADPAQERNGFLDMRSRRGSDYAPL